MPSAQAHSPGDDADRREAGDTEGMDHPILLAEVDDALRDSADVARRRSLERSVAWGDSLFVILETLTYACSVLADDVRILRHRLATDAPSSKEVVDDLPRALTTSSWGTDRSAPDDRSDRAELDPAVFARSDTLLAVHAEMASVDLSSAGDVRRVLAVLEEQLAALDDAPRGRRGPPGGDRRGRAAGERARGDPLVEPPRLKRPPPPAFGGLLGAPIS